MSVSSFNNGKWLRWVVSGPVEFNFTRVSGPNACISGLFIDPAPSGSAFYPTYLSETLVQDPSGSGLIRSRGVDRANAALDRGALVDGLGSVQGTVSGTNPTTATGLLARDAFGNPLSGSGPSATGDQPFQYLGGLGYWEEPEVGLTYVRARWLDTSTATWMSADPVDGEPRYSYAHNGPVMRTDATGKQTQNNGDTEYLRAIGTNLPKKQEDETVLLNISFGRKEYLNDSNKLMNAFIHAQKLMTDYNARGNIRMIRHLIVTRFENYNGVFPEKGTKKYYDISEVRELTPDWRLNPVRLHLIYHYIMELSKLGAKYGAKNFGEWMRSWLIGKNGLEFNTKSIDWLILMRVTNFRETTRVMVADALAGLLKKAKLTIGTTVNIIRDGTSSIIRDYTEPLSVDLWATIHNIDTIKLKCEVLSYQNGLEKMYFDAEGTVVKEALGPKDFIYVAKPKRRRAFRSDITPLSVRLTWTLKDKYDWEVGELTGIEPMGVKLLDPFPQIWARDILYAGKKYPLLNKYGILPTIPNDFSTTSNYSKDINAVLVKT